MSRAHVHAHFPLRWPQLLADRRVLSHAQRGAPAGAGQPRAVGSLGRRSTRSVDQRLATRAGPRAGGGAGDAVRQRIGRSEEHTSELQSLMRISYAVFCLKKNNSYTMI